MGFIPDGKPVDFKQNKTLNGRREFDEGMMRMAFDAEILVSQVEERLGGHMQGRKRMRRAFQLGLDPFHVVETVCASPGYG
jgi:hypothetical protein